MNLTLVGDRDLTTEDITAIHQASLQVLAETGYHLPVAEARQLVEQGGGRVVGERGYFTAQMVQQALDSWCPVRIYDRNGNDSPLLQRGRACFGALSDTFYIHDPYTQVVRPFLKDDQRWLTTVCDALPNIDYIQVVGQAHDVTDALQSQSACAQAVRCTSKPILVYPYDRQGLLDILDLAAIVAGGEAAFTTRPFLMCAAVPAAPLSGATYHLELLLTCAERGVPVLCYNCPAMEGNSPADIVATLVLANADWLANLTLHQLKRPGAPFCTAGFTLQLMDMKTTLWSYCAPETLQGYAAAADLAHTYGLPAFGLEMTSDAPELDAQMGVELQAQAARALLSGVEMVHNAGIYGAGKLCAAEAVILADETIAYTRAACQPLPISATRLAEAVELVAEMGPLAEYVAHVHTLKNFRRFWYPQVFQRPMFDPRRQGPTQGLPERLNQQARKLIETHRPSALSSEVEREIQALEAAWAARLP